jgi:BirA family transcriptional regulator, biotin operon repressor / biotin---[acetyl-CoA-carboxylase] ligase
MDETELQKVLSSLPLSGFRYLPSTGSTNDEALAWAAQGAPDLSLVVADEQTSGRGRSGRKWFTPPGAALAFSLILRAGAAERAHPARTTGLGALALCDCLGGHGLAAQIKWPNDVLLDGKKVAGILVESVWTGEALDASVLGMGVNVLAASVPPADQVSFPATSLEGELGSAVDRLELLGDLLAALIRWRPRLGTTEFIRAWEDLLAYRGRQVIVVRDSHASLKGELLGLEPDGGLRIRAEAGKIQRVQFGEIHLRPLV